ncbi:MAG: methyltransferase domain-containing protein [Candidatus Freyarchaeum deiterrae]
MYFTELIVLALCAVLLLIILVGSFRLKIPRTVSLQGIEDPKAAEAYDRISRMPQFGLIRRSFVKKLKKYAVKGTITDVGCGPGYLLQVIAKELPKNRLVGVDISNEMVEIARANFRSMGHGRRVEFRQGSADNLPFDMGTQDFVVSTLSLHHWADPQSAFDEIYRVLRPGGQMLILDMRRDARRLFLWFLRFAQNFALRFLGANAIRRINEPTGSLLASYTSEEIEEIMTKTSFSDYKIEGKLGWIYIWGKKKAK